MNNAADIENTIVDIMKKAQEEELSNWKDIIAARKEALNAKKSYYDYDRNIKNKTKSIENLRAELSALNEVSNCPIYLIAGRPLESHKLQRRYEIWSSVNVENYENWAISSQASNRGRFND